MTEYLINNEDVVIGRIYREHGIKGFCKVHSFNPEGLFLREGQEYTLLSEDKRRQPTTLEQVQVFQRYFLCKFDCFENPEAIEPWRKAELVIKQKDIPRDGDEIFDFEWPGYTLYNDQEQRLGLIKHLERNPLPQFVVQKESENQEFYVPLTEDWIVEIDPEQKKIVMAIPEGLDDF
ncbi:MAG: 16S rRNA processing protein RimM [Deltaproteobacteria bacterium]|nr:16S rRNA processing protein RimM [Deltaproteobacteria bacterium]